MQLLDGFVKINGATDLEDAPVAAGLCVLTGFNIYTSEHSDLGQKNTYATPLKIDLTNHVKANGFYQRCKNSKYSFSRDQALVLWAGLKEQGKSELVSRDRVDGKDWFLPGNLGHEKRCQGKSSNDFFDSWLKAEIYFHAKFTPIEESNQLLAMMFVAGDKYVNLWTRLNKNWGDSIFKYWAHSFRNEPEFAKHLYLYTLLKSTKGAQ